MRMTFDELNRLIEEGGLTELTRRETYESVDLLKEWQQVRIARMLDFSERLGLRLFFEDYFPSHLYLTDGKVVSEILAGDSRESLDNLVFMLELWCEMRGIDADQPASTDTAGQAALLRRINVLEKRVETLEQSRPSDTMQAFMPACRADTEVDLARGAPSVYQESNYQYYLGLFRELQPKFEAMGLNFQIDEAVGCAYYNNPHSNRRPVCYQISQMGYRRAGDNLGKIEKRRGSLTKPNS